MSSPALFLSFTCLCFNVFIKGINSFITSLKDSIIFLTIDLRLPLFALAMLRTVCIWVLVAPYCSGSWLCCYAALQPFDCLWCWLNVPDADRTLLRGGQNPGPTSGVLGTACSSSPLAVLHKSSECETEVCVWWWSLGDSAQFTSVGCAPGGPVRQGTHRQKSILGIREASQVLMLLQFFLWLKVLEYSGTLWILPCLIICFFLCQENRFYFLTNSVSLFFFILLMPLIFLIIIKIYIIVVIVLLIPVGFICSVVLFFLVITTCISSHHLSWPWSEKEF